MYKKIYKYIENFEIKIPNNEIELSEELSYDEIKNLKKGQNIMTNMLKEFDRMCRNNNIKYWCTSGTLLGVIRHNGWIPYDGDIDVCMLEDDYNKFKKLKLPNDLFLQNYETDSLYKKYGHQYLAKIRHKYSCYTTTRHNKFHHGLQLDIFIMKQKDNKIITPERWSHFLDSDFNDIFPLLE